MEDFIIRGLITLAIVGLILWSLIRSLFNVAPTRQTGGGHYCTHCGHDGGYRVKTRGHLLLEIALWLLFLLPGLIYSIWRISSRIKVCPACEAPGLIPADSPKARKLKTG